MLIKTIHAQLIALKEDVGDYVTLVFYDIDNGEYVMCTKHPNWECVLPTVFETGYLQYRQFEAGVDTWYDTTSESWVCYKYTDLYFWDFVKESDKEPDIYIYKD